MKVNEGEHVETRLIVSDDVIDELTKNKKSEMGIF